MWKTLREGSNTSLWENSSLVALCPLLVFCVKEKACWFLALLYFMLWPFDLRCHLSLVGE